MPPKKSEDDGSGTDDEGVRLSAEQMAVLKAYFAVAKLTEVFFAVLLNSNLSLEDIFMIWDSDPVVAAFAAVLMGFGGMMQRDALMAALHLKSRRGGGAKSGLEGASSSISSIAGKVAEAAISAAAEDKDVGAAALKASAKLADGLELLEGTDSFMRDVLYYGPHVLDQVKGDGQAKSWLAAQRADKGGAICVEAKKGEKPFRAFVKSVTDHDLKLGRVGAVSAMMKWAASVPAWEAGGCQYVVAYMAKHNFTIPEKVDRDLRDDANLESQKDFAAHLQGLRGLDSMYGIMDSVTEELAELRAVVLDCKDLDGEYAGSGEMCFGCMKKGHKKASCPLSHSEQRASKQKYFRVKGASVATLTAADMAAAAADDA